jgi:hypothetical protein
MAIDQEDYFALERRELVHRTRIRSSQEVLKSHFRNDKRLSPYKRGLFQQNAGQDRSVSVYVK